MTDDDDTKLYGKSFFDINRADRWRQEQYERERQIPPTTGQVALGFFLVIVVAATGIALLVWALHS